MEESVPVMHGPRQKPQRPAGGSAGQKRAMWLRGNSPNETTGRMGRPEGVQSIVPPAYTSTETTDASAGQPAVEIEQGRGEKR